MKSRRSFLAFLGLAPVAGVVAAKAIADEPLATEVFKIDSAIDNRLTRFDMADDLTIDNYGQRVYVEWAREYYKGPQWTPEQVRKFRS